MTNKLFELNYFSLLALILFIVSLLGHIGIFIAVIWVAITLGSEE